MVNRKTLTEVHRAAWLWSCGRPAVISNVLKKKSESLSAFIDSHRIHISVLEDRDKIFTQMVGCFPSVFCRGVVLPLNKVFRLSSLNFFGDYRSTS